jgi:large repetitive protein
VTNDQPLAGTPTLLLPADGSSNATGLPTFSWNSVTNGNTYQIQVDNNSDFSSPEFDDAAAATSRTPGSTLADGIYSWRVRATNMYGTNGAWSAVRTITISIPPAAPTLSSPGDASTDGSGTPTFSWSSVTNGNTYQIQVDNNSDFSSPEFDDTAAMTNRTPGTMLADGIYHWRVRAIDVYDTPGEWSVARTVKIDVPPTAPELTAPEDAATDTTGTPTFSWESLPNAKDYQLQVDNDSDFTSPEVDDTAATFERTPSLANGVYSWRVKATNLYDTAGEWSTVRTITIDVPAEVPALTSPADGATDATGTPTFIWSSVTNGATYQIQVDNNSDFSSPEYEDTAATTSRTPTLANGVYFWRVRAITINGTPGGWSSEDWTITIAP